VLRSARRAAAIAAAALVALPAFGDAATPAAPTGAARAALTAAPAAAPLANERFYFVMTDRYANGSTLNDRGGSSSPSKFTNGFDPTDSGWFHGGDFVGLTGGCNDPKKGLQRIKDLGFTALWVTPPFGQRWVQGNSAAYHGYWITDFTTVDPHWGTEQEFADFATCAHSLGLKVYLDVVMNHTGDVVNLSGGDGSGNWIEPTVTPYRDCTSKVFDPATYTTGTEFPCLNDASFAYTPTVLAADQHLKKPDWLNDPTVYHNRGDITWDSCSVTCFEQGDFYGLDDLFTEQWRVVDGLAKVYATWIDRFKVDGFRIDTARHVDRRFFKRFLPLITAAAQTAGVPAFQAFGESSMTDSIELATFSRDRGLPNVLDFPLQGSLARFAGGGAGAAGIGDRLNEDDYFVNRTGVPYVPVTFLGNHDMGRGARMIADAGGAQGSLLLKRVLLGHDLLYLLRGAPVVYYGDEFGLMGSGGDKAARQDLFPTRVPEWKDEERVGSPPIHGGSSFDVTGNAIGARIARLGAIRVANPALASAPSVVRRASGPVLVVTRLDPATGHEYLTAFNNSTRSQTVIVQTSTPNAGWKALLGSNGRRSGRTGRLKVTIPGLSSMLLRATSGVPRVRAAAPAIAVRADDLSSLWTVTARIATNDPARVTIAIKQGTAAWRVLATDQAAPYRAFIDPAAFRTGEKVWLVAIVRTTAGSTAVSKVVSFTVRRNG
jgi:glycosidase